MIKKVFAAALFIVMIQSQFLFSQSYYDFELAAIKFTGNNYFSESDLKANIESKESPMWFWKFLNSFTPFGNEPVYFDSSNISIDKHALREYYRSYGFFNMSADHFITIDSTNRTIELSYQIIENHSADFGKLTLFGLNKLSDYDYARMYGEAVNIDSSKQFSESTVQSMISSIQRFLANNGYVFGGYDSTIVIIDSITNRTNVDVYFSTGDRYSVSETIINKTGKSIDQINNKLINEITDIKPGTFYNQSQIDRSELRLLKTDLFNSLSINPVLSDTVNHTIPIEINTTIGSLNGLSPEIKADNEFNYFNVGLGISYTRKNLFGDARKLSLSTSFRLIDILHLGNIFASNSDSTNQGVFDLNLEVEQPFLFGRPILTSTEVYLRSQKFREFSENSYGGAQKFDFEMPTHTFITLLRPFLSIDITERENRIDFTSGGSDNKIGIEVSSFTPGVGVELGSSKTNDILFPTSGNFLFFTPELFHSRTKYSFTLNQIDSLSNQLSSSITGSTYFYRLQTGLSSYISIDKENKSVFASKLRIGYAQTFTVSQDTIITAESLIPPNKTFYAGGSNSVRGWKARELVPKETIEYAGITTETDEIRGGTFWFEGSFELRQKLHEYFGYAAFIDYGNTWNGWKQMAIKDIAVAVGLGIRVYTPIAPFRIDFGAKFYDPKDNKMIFKKNFLDNINIHFGIGEAF